MISIYNLSLRTFTKDIVIFRSISLRVILVVHNKCWYCISKDIWFSSISILLGVCSLIDLVLLFNKLTIRMSLLISIHIHWRHCICLWIHIGICLWICIWIISSLTFISTRASTYLRDKYRTIASSFLCWCKVIFKKLVHIFILYTNSPFLLL